MGSTQRKVDALIRDHGYKVILGCIMHNISNELMVNNDVALVDLYETIEDAILKYESNEFQWDGTIMGNGFEEEGE